MRLHHIEEPRLAFGQKTHVCPRAGIAAYNVYDTKLTARRDKILVGAVGLSGDLRQLEAWVERCRTPIPGRSDSKQPNLFPPFCGFNKQYGFKAELVVEDEIQRTIGRSEIRAILEADDPDECARRALDLYYRHIKFLTQNRVVDVVVCVIPDELYEQMATPVGEEVEEGEKKEDVGNDLELNFRRALKARAMHLGRPLQLAKGKTFKSNVKGQQDDATKAWNLCTALYYKANQTVPWRLVRGINRPSDCFIGIGFYRSRDRETLHTSLAQVFDELGNGVILRGTPVTIDKDDRIPHLTGKQAEKLMQRALSEYEVALEQMPARIVVHKSSNFSDDELEGFSRAAREMRVSKTDFVTVRGRHEMRGFREGVYPPRRGTHIELDRETHLLFTRGSVDYYNTYPGMYVPQPLEVRIVESDEAPEVICEEILGLSKMNWNNTQFDGKYPITIGCARKVGQVMKYLPPGEKPQISYSYYM